MAPTAEYNYTIPKGVELLIVQVLRILGVNSDQIAQNVIQAIAAAQNFDRRLAGIERAVIEVSAHQLAIEQRLEEIIGPRTSGGASPN